MNDMLIIGIAGGTGSGKSTIAEKIAEKFKGDVQLLRHDSYYKNQDDITYEERVKQNYDCPSAFDTALMIEQIKQLKNGVAIDAPLYDFGEHTRSKETEHIVPTRVLVIDGILIFSEPELRDLMNIKIFVDTDADIRILRRIKRDVKERRRTLDSVINQYLNTVKPMHEAFVEPSKKYADIIVPQGGHNQVALDMIFDKIHRYLS